MLLAAKTVSIAHPHVALNREQKGGIVEFIFVDPKLNNEPPAGSNPAKSNAASNSDEKSTEKESLSRWGDDILQR